LNKGLRLLELQALCFCALRSLLVSPSHLGLFARSAQDAKGRHSTRCHTLLPLELLPAIGICRALGGRFDLFASEEIGLSGKADPGAPGGVREDH
jgi:hypothetical protein